MLDYHYRRMLEILNERRLNREMRNRIGEVFGELAWEAQQVFSEKPEQGEVFTLQQLRECFPLSWKWSVKV